VNFKLELLKPSLRSHFSVLIVTPSLLVGAISLPAQGQVKQDQGATVAQLLDTPSPQSGNPQAVAQAFFTSLARQNFEQARQYVSPSIKDYSSAAQLQQLWQSLTEQLGSFVEIAQIYPTELLGTYNLLVTVRFEKSTEDFIVRLDQNQQITGINFPQLNNIQTAAESFVDALSHGDYALARSYLSPDLKQKFLPETLKQRWEALLTKAGAWKGRSGSTLSRSSEGYDIVAMTLEFENYSGKFLVFFNPLGRIVGVSSPLNRQP
jgi:hypothetical protein